MRISRRILEIKLNQLAKSLGKEVGFKEGQWALDHNSIYGGYIVVEFEENGGESHPLLRKRLRAEAMSYALDMSWDAVQLIRKETQNENH